MASADIEETTSKLRFRNQPGFLTRVALQRVTSIFSEVFRHENLTPTQHMTLVAIDHLGETTQRRLSRYKGMAPSNLHGILSTLAKRELISITQNPESRRSSVIKLTAKGRRTLRRLDPLDAEVSKRYLSPLTTAEQRQFKKLLLRIAFSSDNEL